MSAQGELKVRGPFSWVGPLEDASTPTDKGAVQRQIVATDGQIDALVYELYALTDEEIRIVEEAKHTP